MAYSATVSVGQGMSMPMVWMTSSLAPCTGIFLVLRLLSTAVLHRRLRTLIYPWDCQPCAALECWEHPRPAWARL
jgi:hypothetical protein